MNEHGPVGKVGTVGIGALAAAAFLTACGSSTPPASTPGTPGAYPSAYAGAPGAYPGAQPGYATAPPGYAPAAPQAYATAAQPGYAAPPPGYPGAAPAAAPPAYAQPGVAPAAAPTVGPGQAPGQPTPAPLAQTDPNSLQGILQGLQNAMTGTVVPGGGTVPGDLTEAGLRAFALKAAPGMQPEGDLLKQNLTEGQHAVMMVTLQAGKCYTILGFSGLGAVKDVDLNLLAPPLYMTLAGQDLTHNNTPAIGQAPNPMCPVIAYPLQYKLDVFARSGSGAVAAQLYSKAKN